MATGHLNPGYGNVAKNMRHYPTTSGGGQPLKSYQSMSEDPMRLDDIRKKAREVWAQPNLHQTSYGDHFTDKMSEIDEYTKTRPTSPTRKNKPHPPLVFLATRLHDVPGYHNPDAVMGKDVYRVDASLSPDGQDRRAHLRSKYIGRPMTSAVHQYKTREELASIPDPVERQAVEAYLKLASDKDIEKVPQMVREEDMVNVRGPALLRSHRPRTVPSLHRYLREAGAQEAQQLDDIYHKGLQGHYRHNTPGRNDYTVDLGTKRQRELQSTTQFRYVHTSKRGDFLMHPQWPPSMEHHRLNGLSSVDLPYVPGRR